MNKEEGLQEKLEAVEKELEKAQRALEAIAAGEPFYVSELRKLLLSDEFVRKLADAIMSAPLKPVTLKSWFGEAIPEEHRA